MKIKTQALALGAHQYAIVDQALVGQFPMADYPCVSLAPEKGLHQAHLYPVLLHLNLMEPAEQKKLFGLIEEDVQAGYAPMASMFLQTSHTSHDDIAEHLKTHMLLQADGRSYLSRFYDPNVLKQFNWLMDDAYLTDLSGPITAWTFYQHKQAYSLMPQPRMDQSMVAPTMGELRLIGLINQVYLKLNWSLSLPENEAQARIVWQHLQQGQALGLKQDDDLVLFAVHKQWLPNGFEKHDLFQQALRSKQSSYVQFLEMLEAEQWQLFFNEVQFDDMDLIRKVMYG